jgi:hypothetical protein
MTRTIQNRNGKIQVSATLALALGLAWSAEASAECTAPPYHASDSDQAFSAAADKNSLYDGPSDFVDWKSYYADRFGFQSDEGWGGDYGWGDKDNPKLPTGRTLGAIFLLHHSDEEDTPDWNTHSGHMLKWMYGYTAGAYNELDDLRAGGCHEWKAADTDDEWYQDSRIILYQSFFQSNVVVRAGTLMHEAIHYRSGMSHTDGDKGDAHFYYDQYHSVPSGRGYAWVLNPNPQYISVYGAEAHWHLEYFNYAVRHTNNIRRNAALRRFKDIIKNNISNHDTLPDYVADARTESYLET